MTWPRRGPADWLAGAALGALVFAWFGHAFLNYDTFYALVWGGDLAHGRTPQYEIAVAPTPHPLATLTGALLSPFGDSAEDLMLAIVLLALGMLAVGLFRLGQELFGTAAGVLAAAIVLTRVPVLSFGIRGYVDLPTAAFVVWAAVLEVRRPRRGAPVLILLGLAGLLRPEAWLYAAAYLVWLRPPLRLLLLGAAAPAIWLLSDLIVTGNPLHSLSGTHDLAAELGRRTGITSLPEIAPRRLGEILRLPELVAAVAGLGFALAWMRQRVALPVAIAALNGLAFTAFAVARLPLLGRYLFVAAAMLTVLAGAGALGWLALPRDHPGRRPWTAVGAAALAAIAILFAVQQVDRLGSLKDDIAARDRIQADLHSLVTRADARAALERCPKIGVLSHRPVPLVALWADRRPEDFTTERASSCMIWPATPEVARLSILDPKEPVASDDSYTGDGGIRNRSWVLVTGP